MDVLVVDDDAHARQALGDKLQSRGHRVVECATAEQGLAQHANGSFPLILVDWVLPTMDGLALCRRIRALPNGALPVIVFITARSGAADLVRGLDSGADDYLTKPLDPELLGTRLAIAERMAEERARSLSTKSALLSSEAGFRALIEGSPDGIIVHRAGRVVYVNPSLLAALDYKSAALVGASYMQLIRMQDRVQESAWVQQVVESSKPAAPREVRLIRRDGTPAVFEEVVIPTQFEGQHAVAALLRDLSERKRMEQRLMLADRMVSIGTLAAGIAHEINNPLSYVMANLRFIQDEVAELATNMPASKLAGLRELIAQADDGAERVRVVIQDLKSFSRATPTEDGPVEVQRVLDGAINMAWNEIRHRAQLEKRYELVPQVRGTETRLGQVFINLLINAAQAIPVGRAGDNRITVSVKRCDDAVLIEVSDTGCGIPSEALGRIFDPFFTTKPVGVGTGLGLSICHNIVSSLGGDITVESQVDVGTTFRVLLPTARVSAVQPRLLPSIPVRTSARALRILVVDDEPSILRALQRALRDHHVSIALSGSEALDVLDSGQDFELVFCDLMMANLSGMDLYEAVRQRYPGFESRFVFMTGGAFTPQAKEFLSAVPNPLMEKPFDIRAVQRLVRDRLAA
jgi:PAS domain S-box-containing protein